MKKPKIIAVFIAYNAEKTLLSFWEDFPKEYFDEIILIDDASSDKTFEIAKELKGLKSYQNKSNLGYGGNLKKGIMFALDRGADIIAEIHPDGEYKPSAIPLALDKIRKENANIVLGDRFHNFNRIFKSGMYIWKIFPIIALSQIDKAVLGIKINDFHQGFRFYTRRLFDKILFENNSNNYIFSFELISQAAFKRMKFGQVPVETSYKGNKRGATFKNSIQYSLDTFKVLGLFLFAKMGLGIEIFKTPKENLHDRISRFLNA